MFKQVKPLLYTKAAGHQRPAASRQELYSAEIFFTGLILIAFHVFTLYI